MRERSLLVRADALATPATAFESNREKVEEAVADSEPGATALNMESALEFARHRVRVDAVRSAGDVDHRLPGRGPGVQDNRHAQESVVPHHRHFKRLAFIRGREERNHPVPGKEGMSRRVAWLEQHAAFGQIHLMQVGTQPFARRESKSVIEAIGVRHNRT
jgi:hypothetical protein